MRAWQAPTRTKTMVEHFPCHIDFYGRVNQDLQLFKIYKIRNYMPINAIKLSNIDITCGKALP